MGRKQRHKEAEGPELLLLPAKVLPPSHSEVLNDISCSYSLKEIGSLFKTFPVPPLVSSLNVGGILLPWC